MKYGGPPRSPIPSVLTALKSSDLELNREIPPNLDWLEMSVTKNMNIALICKPRILIKKVFISKKTKCS